MTGPDVYGAAEARAILGVGKARLPQLARKPDFPAYRDLEIGRVWDGAEIRAYALSRTGAPLAGKPVLAALHAWRRTYVLSQAAREVGVSTPTIARWLKRIGAPVPRHG